MRSRPPPLRLPLVRNPARWICSSRLNTAPRAEFTVLTESPNPRPPQHGLRWARRKSMKKRLLIAGPVAALASLILPGAAFGAETPILETPEASINTMWVIVAAVLVMFMQAGFLLLEIGFSRAKNVGAGVAKILVNFSIASLCLLGGRLRARLRRRRGRSPGTPGSSSTSAPSIEEAGKAVPVRRNVLDQPGRVHVLPVRVLRGLAGDRLGHHAGADQVRRLRHLRGHLQRRDLPGDQPLDLRWRLAAGERRHAGLRRLHGGPPDRCDRCLRGAAAARPAHRQVRRQTASRGRSRGTRCRWSASAC